MPKCKKHADWLITFPPLNFASVKRKYQSVNFHPNPGKNYNNVFFLYLGQVTNMKSLHFQFEEFHFFQYLHLSQSE